MGKGLKIKQCLPSPTKYGENVFIEKLCMGEETFLGEIFGGMFYMETNDQIMQGGKLMVKSFKGRVKLVFPLI